MGRQQDTLAQRKLPARGRGHRSTEHQAEVKAGCQIKKKKNKTGQEKEGTVVLKNGDTLEQVHFMMVLLRNKKSPTHTHLLKRKQEMFSQLESPYYLTLERCILDLVGPVTPWAILG